MKLNRTVFALAISLATILASTGCKHGFNSGITNIPGHNEIDGTPGAGTMPGGESPLAAAPLDLFEGMAMDRQALAIYSLHFSYDSAAIRKTERANLQAVAATLQSDPSTKLLIEGNCDERGTEEYNRSLGQRRADAAREALSKLGIDPMRIRTLSNGKDKPVATGHDENSWKENRRDDFILLRPKAGA